MKTKDLLTNLVSAARVAILFTLLAVAFAPSPAAGEDTDYVYLELTSSTASNTLAQSVTNQSIGDVRGFVEALLVDNIYANTTQALWIGTQDGIVVWTNSAVSSDSFQMLRRSLITLPDNSVIPGTYTRLPFVGKLTLYGSSATTATSAVKVKVFYAKDR